jgi:dUTP pyrophosphatase
MEDISVPLLSESDQWTPQYATNGAAGADLKAAIAAPVVIPPGESRLVSTGIRLAIPEGFEMQVRPRSGLALKSQITVLNTPGTIDADYRGVIGVILINHGKEPFTVTPGMRIAQLVLAPVVRARFVVHAALEASARGEGGFGHTGSQ